MRNDRPFKIDGVPIPTPSDYKFNIEDLSSEETGRTLDGVMHKDVVDVKDTYTCTWKRLSWEDMATLLTAIDGKEEFNFTHADPRMPNRWPTSKFYVGARTGAALDLTRNLWVDLTLTFIRI